MRSCFRPVLALLLCGALVACARAEPERSPMARVERGPIERIVVATGTIEPENEVEVRPRVPGIVEKITIEAGDRVKKEQVLVELERELLEAQVAEARAAVRAQQVERRFARIRGVAVHAFILPAVAEIRLVAVEDCESSIDEYAEALGRLTVVLVDLRQPDR